MEKYKNELKVTRQLSIDIYNNFFTNKLNKQNKQKNRGKCSKFCDNFIQNKECIWYKKGICKFAHSIEDFSKSKILKIIEFGIQGYYDINNINIEKFTNIFDYADAMFNDRKISNKNAIEFDDCTKQYKKLNEFIIKKETEFRLQNKLFSRHINNDYNNIYEYCKLNIFRCNEIDEIKKILNEYIVCKICYKNIFNFGNDDYTLFSDDLVSLSCGHSICNVCYINIINNKSTIYNHCPVCRNDNKIEYTKPNYELNEQYLKIKILIKLFNNMATKFEKYKNEFITTRQNNSQQELHYHRQISYEAPW